MPRTLVDIHEFVCQQRLNYDIWGGRVEAVMRSPAVRICPLLNLTACCCATSPRL